jgi:hypothetical protein
MAIYFGCTAALCIWAARPSPQRLRQRGEQFARTNQAFIDSEFVAAFDRATVRSARFAAGCGGLVLAMVWVLMRHEPEAHDLSPSLLTLPVVAGLVACWAGWRLHDAGREFPVSEGRAVVARPRRVETRDYLSQWAQYGAWATVVVSGGLAVGASVQWNRGNASLGFAAMAGVNAMALLVATLVTQLSFRAMCERPQPAVDPCHLYFYDAWRGEFVRNAYLIIWWSQLQFVTSVAPWLNWPRVVDDHILETVMLYFGGQLGLLFRSSHLRFRRRLWPTLAKGQVLLPGQAAPPREGVAA